MITSAVVMRLLSSLPSAIYSCVLYHYIIEQAINKGVMIRATQQPRDKKYDGKSRLRGAGLSALYLYKLAAE
jgi:hypothetical protein